MCCMVPGLNSLVNSHGRQGALCYTYAIYYKDGIQQNINFKEMGKNQNNYLL